MQIFLSYSHDDASFANALSEQLEKRGISVWKPEDEILPGEKFWERIGDALKASTAMIVLLSPESVRSQTQQKEIEYALGNPKYKGRVFPVEVRPTRDIPWILRTFNLLQAKQGAAKIGTSIAEAVKLEPASR